jgi:hypothetical protein
MKGRFTIAVLALLWNGSIALHWWLLREAYGAGAPHYGQNTSPQSMKIMRQLPSCVSTPFYVAGRSHFPYRRDFRR